MKENNNHELNKSTIYTRAALLKRAKIYFILAVVFFIEFLIALIVLKSFVFSSIGLVGSIVMMVFRHSTFRLIIDEKDALIKNEELLAEHEKLLKEESEKENIDNQ